MVRQEESDLESVSMVRDFRAEVDTEHDALADAVCARIREGSLPPDEAYWWARILVEGAIARLAGLSPGRPSRHGCRDCGCSGHTAQAA